MGLLDGMLGGAMGGGRPRQGHGLGSTVAAGLVLALLVKGVRQYQASHPAGGVAPPGRSFDPQAPQVPAGQALMPDQGGGLGGILGSLTGAGGLGGLLGGGGLGGLLGGLGGAGALGALISQFQQKGYGQQVNSWVSPGPNQPIAPHEVADALGEDTVQQLQQQTGLPRDALLQDLTHVLPEAVNEVTPQGRAPNDEELHQIATGAGPLAS